MKIFSKRHPQAVKQEPIQKINLPIIMHIKLDDLITSQSMAKLFTTNLCPEIVPEEPTIDFNQISGSVDGLEKILSSMSQDDFLKCNFFHEANDDHDSISQDPFSPRYDSKARFYSRADDRLGQASSTETECGAEQALVGYKARLQPEMDTGCYFAPYLPSTVSPIPRAPNMHRYLGVEDTVTPEMFDKLSRRTIMEYFFDVNTAGL